MSSRCQELGWTLCCMHDPVGRRGIWYRFVPNPHAAAPYLEICGGREGDDCYARFTVGEITSGALLRCLEDILQTGSWMLEQQEDLDECERQEREYRISLGAH